MPNGIEGPIAASDNKCSELGACGALPPGDVKLILSMWAGGHVALWSACSAYGAARVAG
jgi:hypothetical protein